MRAVADDDGSSAIGITAVAPLASGGGLLSADSSLCFIHGSNSDQPFLCGPQSSGE